MSNDKIKCQICGKGFKNKIQYRHLKSEHNITIMEYEFRFGVGSADINYVAPIIPIDEQIECLECNQIFRNTITHSHLKLHGMSLVDYKNKYGDDSTVTRFYRDERSKRYTGKNNPNYGNTMSDVAKERISLANSGRTPYNLGGTTSDEIKQKISKTKLENFASGKNVAWNKGGTVSAEVRDKISKSVKEYANDNPELMRERALKANQTLLERYGEDYMIQKQKDMIAAITTEGKEKQRETIIKANKNKSKIAIQQLYDTLDSLNYTVKEYDHDTKTIVYICDNGKQHSNHRMYFDACRNDLNECKMCIPKNQSKGELELTEYVESLVGSENVSTNNKSIIWPYELDVYIPTLNIAIEFNGLYWHSVEMGKDKDYHINKTNLCEEHGIELIHVFEDEWEYKKDIVKSILKHKLLPSSNRVFARKCVVKEIDTPTARTFIDTHHLYGYKPSKVKFGLYHNNELLQVMTFSTGNHSRKQLGWEIDRFATKFNYQVVGGASKIFKHFIKTYNPTEIISYADLRYGEGNVYKQLGFSLENRTAAGYFYFKASGIPIRIHRYNMRKTKEENETGKTEFVLRREQGYNRIYDCGHNKWKWSNPT